MRVRAFNTDGLEIFKNNGYSEVRVFQFGETCNSPISFDLNDETQSTFNIEVQTDPSNTAWQANFRESESNDWSELKAEGASSEKTVRGLKASTTYEVQLKGLCGPFASDFTFSKTITTKERTNTERICENTSSPFVVTNALPLPQLKKDHIFLAALVPIKVSQVTKQGGGKFSGNGIATLPFFNAGLAVTFDDIQINELMQLTSGEVNVVRNAFNPTFFGDELPPTDGTSGGSNPDSTGNGTWPPFTDTITINVPFDSIIVVNDSTIWVIPSGGGEAIVVDLGGSTCTLILPPDGNLDNAKVVYNGAARPYNSSNSNDGSLELFTGFLANFDPSPTQAYGFDSLKFSGFADYYNEMDVNGKVFKMPWKALAPNSYEPVNLKIRRSSDSFPYSDLKVGIWGGDDLVPVAGSNTALQTYNLKGTNEGDEYAIVAKFNSDDKEVHAGGICAVTYQPKSFNLYIVALEGSNIDEECARMQNEITTIYKQALVNWSVKPLYGFKGIALGDNGLDWTNSEFLSAYNTEMNSVISAFKDWHPNSDPDAYYLFVVPKFSDNTVEGFMPRNRRFGFISAEQLYSRNVAHELGHGAFNLRHTFPEVQQYSTDNLMDYPPSGGQAAQDKFALLKAQWDLIHNPESTTGLFDEMEDGASTTTPVNENWTTLFNHIQKNHNTLDQYYLNKILLPISEDFKLEYGSDSISWNKEKRDFMREWKIRALDIDKDKAESNFVSTNELNAGSTLNKIFDAIRIADDGEKIGKIELRSKKIYLGKLEFRGKEYFFALYGNGRSTNLENVFTKRQVETIADLEDKTHVYSIYCDDTPNNYMIIGFLESGKSEPSMAIQISKAGLTDWLLSKEDWLENLNIYKPNDKKQTDGLLTLYNGDNEEKDPVNFFPTITATPDPAMPKNLKIKFNGSTGEKANITVKISYRITYSYDGKTYPFDDGNTTIEIKDAEANKLYPLAFTSIRGGTVTVTCETTN